MRAATLLLALLSCGLHLGAEDNPRLAAPSYSIASIVNAATNRSGAIAPNTLVTIYGVGLSYETRAIQPDDLIGNQLPARLPGSGVSVLVGTYTAHVLFASPNQVNVLIPNLLRAGKTKLQVVRDGQSGPDVEIRLSAAAPALFQSDATTPIVTRPDGSLVTRESPANPGEIVILYATGLGPTDPQALYGEIPMAAAQLKEISAFQVWLGGVSLAPEDVLYAGVCPGFAGLYQVNLRLPASAPPNPELRLAVGAYTSPSGIYLPLHP